MLQSTVIINLLIRQKFPQRPDLPRGKHHINASKCAGKERIIKMRYDEAKIRAAVEEYITGVPQHAIQKGFIHPSLGLLKDKGQIVESVFPKIPFDEERSGRVRRRIEDALRKYSTESELRLIAAILDVKII